MTTGVKSRGRGALFAALALGVGLFAFIGVRVKETLADRESLKSTLDQQVAAKDGKRAGVEVARPKPATWRPAILVTGTLAPIQDADIGFKSGGRLDRVRVKVGDRVKAGQPLAGLDVSEASAQASATGAGVRAAEVSLEMAKDAERRVVALFQQNATTEADHLAAQNRTALAKAQLEQARAQARLASVGVGNGSLAAPFAGLVTRAPNGVGKIVGPGEALFHLEDTSVLKLSATLTEADARLVEVGDAIAIDGAGSGKVTAVLGSLDPQTRRVPIVAEIPNDGERPMLAGAFVRATVRAAREVPVLELPSSALRPGSQDELVLVRGGKAHLVRVIFSAAPDGTLLVRSGVDKDSIVVAGPSSEVREGDEIAAK